MRPKQFSQVLVECLMDSDGPYSGKHRLAALLGFYAGPGSVQQPCTQDVKEPVLLLGTLYKVLERRMLAIPPGR